MKKVIILVLAIFQFSNIIPSWREFFQPSNEKSFKTFWKSHRYLVENEFTPTISTKTAQDMILALDFGKKVLYTQTFPAYESFYHILYSNINGVTSIEIETPQDQTLITILKDKNSQFMDLLLKNIIQTKVAFYTETALHAIIPKTQEHIDSVGIIPAIDEVQNIETYITNSQNLTHLPELLTDYQNMVEIRGDGNCGYRAIVGSMLMNAILSNNLYIIHNFANFVQHHFTRLFVQYDTLFDESIRNEVGKTLETILINQLRFIEKNPSISSVKNVFNNTIEFDFFIIMFLRYFIVDHVLTNSNLHNDIQGLFGSIDTYKENILTWKTYIDNFELPLLSNILSLKIVAILESDPRETSDNPLLQNPKIFTPRTANLGLAVITNTGDHYNVALPKTFDIQPNYYYGVNLHAKKDFR